MTQEQEPQQQPQQQPQQEPQFDTGPGQAPVPAINFDQGQAVEPVPVPEPVAVPMPVPVREFDFGSGQAVEPVPVPVPEPMPEHAPMPAPAPVLAPTSAPGLEPEEEIDAEQALFNAHFKPIPPARIKKARRTKVTLIFIIIILLVVLGGLGFLGYKFLFVDKQAQTTGVSSTATSIDTTIKDSSPKDIATLKTTNVPNLASFFGLQVTEVQAKLGQDYVLTKNDAITENENEDIKQLVVLTYQPKDSAAAKGAVAMPTIYLSLNEEGRVLEIFYQSSLEALDYPVATFSSFITTQDMLYNMLRGAGVSPASSYNYPQLTPDLYTIYVDPAADVKKIKKEEFVFTGATNSENPPTWWQVKLTYDYGSTGATQGTNAKPNQRLITISLK